MNNIDYVVRTEEGDVLMEKNRNELQTISFGSLLIALLAFLDKRNMRK